MVFQKAEIFILQGFVLLCSMNMLYTPKVLLFKFQENRKICLHWFVWILFCLNWTLSLNWIHLYEDDLRELELDPELPAVLLMGGWGHGSCLEDCQSLRKIIVWQRAWKTNWAAYCHLWMEQNTKLLTAGTWIMKNISKGIIQNLLFLLFSKGFLSDWSINQTVVAFFLHCGFLLPTA